MNQESATPNASLSNEAFLVSDVLTQFSDGLRPLLDDAVQCKKHLLAHQALLDDAFCRGENVENLVRARARLIDLLLESLWRHQQWDNKQRICLIAVGGYGRGELHPRSDVDLLILLERELSKKNKAIIESLVTWLWDAGLDLGHSVRTIKDCTLLAREDITVFTNLLESRVIVGDVPLFELLKEASDGEKIWTSGDFFTAKWEEQRNRHRGVDNSEYNVVDFSIHA